MRTDGDSTYCFDSLIWAPYQCVDGPNIDMGLFQVLLENMNRVNRLKTHGN
jgi:uncharacterized protein YycO